MAFFRNFLVSVFAHRAGMLLSFARAGSKKSLARRSQSAVLCLQRAVVCSAAVAKKYVFPSLSEIKNKLFVLLGFIAASIAFKPGIEIGPTGSPDTT